MRSPTRFLLLFFALAVPAPAAGLEKFKDWPQSPEFVLLATDDERKAWKNVATDADAEKFVALFWAKRDPDVKTPENEFRERFEALVKLADEGFTFGRRRGALSERGKAVILIGRPKQVVKKVDPSAAAPVTPSITVETGSGSSSIYQFLYEEAQLPKWSDLKTLELRFQVDESLQVERVVEGLSALRRLEKKAVEVAIVNPGLKEAPVYKTREEIEIEQKATNEAAAEAAIGPALSAPAKETLEASLAKEPFGPLTLMSLAYRDGATRLMAQLYVPGGGAPAPQGAKLAILVRDKAGKDAARVEEPAGLKKSKGDFFLARTIRALPGTYDVAAALLDASGKVLVAARRTATVAPLPTAFGASALLVACDDFPADAPKPDDPFTFSSRFFVARGENRLDATDGLSYAVRIYNPTVDPVNRTVLLKRSMKVKPKNGAGIDVPLPADEPAPEPAMKDGKTALAVDLAGNIVENRLGRYFNAGEYELRLTVTDGVSGQKIELMAPFTVVGNIPPVPGKK